MCGYTKVEWLEVRWQQGGQRCAKYCTQHGRRRRSGKQEVMFGGTVCRNQRLQLPSGKGLQQVGAVLVGTR